MWISYDSKRMHQTSRLERSLGDGQPSIWQAVEGITMSGERTDILEDLYEISGFLMHTLHRVWESVQPYFMPRPMTIGLVSASLTLTLL